MTSAKITRCNHYFHGVCLRKWLYVQDRCPFCHEIIMNLDPTAARNANAQQDEPNDDDAAIADADAVAAVPPIDENGIEALEDAIDL